MNENPRQTTCEEVWHRVEWPGRIFSSSLPPPDRCSLVAVRDRRTQLLLVVVLTAAGAFVAYQAGWLAGGSSPRRAARQAESERASPRARPPLACCRRAGPRAPKPPPLPAGPARRDGALDEA